MRGTVLLLILLIGCSRESEVRAAEESAPSCDPPQLVAPLPGELREASGVAVSRRHPGILWVHNDSGEPVLFALDTLGKLRARISVAARNSDWEDIAVGPCDGGSCLYIGAIGDNLQHRDDRVILRLPEPALDAARVTPAERFRYRLPNGSHDTEALFVMPDQQMYLVTKGRSGPVTLFAFPNPASTREINVLEPIQTLTPGLVQLPDMVTGAGATPDGRVVVIRSYSALQLYSFDGRELEPLLATSGFDLQALQEAQGEGVDITAAGTIYLVSEKGFGDEDPPLSKVSCVLSAP